MRNPFSSLVLLIPIAASCLIQPTNARSPNILFVYVDDLGWKDVGFMGSDFYETPNLDRVASKGVTFSNAYSCAANCAPARACLLSGQYTPRHRIYNVGTKLRGNKAHSRLKHVKGKVTLPPDIVTWAHRLQRAGYKTGHFGKWHLSRDPRPYGFDVNVGGNQSGSPPGGYFAPFRKNAPGLQQANKGEYLTDIITEATIDFIESNAAQPWCAYLSHWAVHTPLQAKPELIAKYQDKHPGKYQFNSKMAAMIQSMDEGFGKILKTLDRLSISEQTVIIFTSDNGGYGGATSMRPLKGYKGTYYEGGIRVPMFVYWPGVTKAAAKSSVPVIGTDLYPTLCEIASAELPSGQISDGVSIVPLLRSEVPGDELAKRDLFWHFPAYLQGYHDPREQRDALFRSRPCSIIRSGDWKLHHYIEGNELELYNLAEDIGERNNVAEKFPDQAILLKHRLDKWRAAVKAPVPSEKNPDFDPDRERLAIQAARDKFFNHGR